LAAESVIIPDSAGKNKKTTKGHRFKLVGVKLRVTAKDASIFTFVPTSRT
jgi:hypothetical protein